MKSYNYESTTHKELLKIIKWCQNRLSMRDWTITLITTDNPPPELSGELAESASTCGMSVWIGDDETGVVWLPLRRLEALNVSAVVTCIHEVLHCVMDKIRVEKEEYVVNLLSPTIYESWLYDMQKMSKTHGTSRRDKSSKGRKV